MIKSVLVVVSVTAISCGVALVTTSRLTAACSMGCHEVDAISRAKGIPKVHDYDNVFVTPQGYTGNALGASAGVHTESDNQIAYSRCPGNNVCAFTTLTAEGNGTLGPGCGSQKTTIERYCDENP